MRNTAYNQSQLMLSLTGKIDPRLGISTTVKEQVDDIEVSIQHFKKSLQGQRKTQSQVQMQLKKLQQSAKTDFQLLHQEISERVKYLTDVFKTDNTTQNKQFEYLQLQNQTLHDEHDKLSEMASSIFGRTQEVQNNVGV